MTEEWTFSTLKVHLDALRQADKEAVGTALAAAEKAVTAALTASEKAILKAENASDKRMENLNELRAVVTDQQRNFAAKSETDFRIGAVEKRLEEMALALSATGGRGAGTDKATLLVFQVIAALAALTAIVLGLVAFWGKS